MEELWKRIEGFEYEISNKGRVRRITPEANTYVGKLLGIKPDKDGYKTVTLSLRGKPYTLKIHRLICHAFNGPPPVHIGQKIECRHLDGNKENNDPTNLRWGTPKENAADRKRHGTQTHGERHNRALFTDEEVRRFRLEYSEAKRNAILRGKKYVPRGFVATLAKREGVDSGTLHRILSGGGYK